MMQFIVLGLVPGTDIQIGFDAITTIAGVTAMVFMLWLLAKEHKTLRSMQKQLDHINSASI